MASQARRVEVLLAQPPQMGAGPRVAAVVHDSAAQQQLRDSVPGPHQITTDVIPDTHQVTSRLLLDRRHRHRDDLIQAQELGQVQGIAVLTRSPAGRWIFDR
jgi:polysaccharide deacetylase 2 family uncharacterized protein YibQ